MVALTPACVCLVLHAHLPDVRAPRLRDALEERLYFEAVINCYVPLADALRRLAETGAGFRLTMSFSPTLLAMAGDKDLAARLGEYLARSTAAAHCLVHEHDSLATRAHLSRIESTFAALTAQDGDWLRAYLRLARAGRVELWTTSTTHAVLPLIASPRALGMQIDFGLRFAEQAFGVRPAGFWLPECGYSAAVDSALARCGVTTSIVDRAAFERARPRPPTGPFAPVVSPAGVRYLARDTELCDLVWSRERGFPGAAEYLDFHSDARDALPGKWAEPLDCPGVERAPTNVRVHAVTDRRSPAKRLYDPPSARARALADAGEFVRAIGARRVQLEEAGLEEATFALAFDAELFGHWWSEGPVFLEEALSLLHHDTLLRTEHAAVAAWSEEATQANLATSTWGQGEGFSVWTEAGCDAMNVRLRRIERAYEARSRTRDLDDEVGVAAAVLEAEASDYAFMIATGANDGYGCSTWEERLERAEALLAANELERSGPRARLAEVLRPEWLKE